MSEFQLIKPETVNKLATVSAVLTQYEIMSEQGNLAKAMATGAAIYHLQKIFDDEAFKVPIMNLCGNVLGFKTDRPNKSQPAYEWPVIRDNVIRALMLGLNTTGNQFNIIAGQTYVTSEGTEAILKKSGVKFTTTEGLPIDEKNGYHRVPVTLEWSGNVKELSFLVKGAGEHTTVDALQGKARSKAKKWLLRHVSNNPIEFDDEVNPAVETTAKELFCQPDELKPCAAEPTELFPTK